ncbi:MAG: hypothetical protein WBH56_04110, partial [Bacteroidota bacterium]
MRLLFTSTLTLGYLLLATVYGIAADKPARGTDLQKNTVLEWKQLDGNQINCTIASDGPFADYRKTDNSGFEWPKDSGKTAIFTAGLWIIGQHRPSDSLRTACMDYITEYQPGPLLAVFNTTTNDDTGPVARAGDERYRLYKIDREDTASADYVGWPGDLGAPYVDVNENGRWDPSVDRPRFYGDQQIWAVINDVNDSLHARQGATPPMGLEVQMLYYALNTPHPLENTMFIHWRILNKSDADYDSVYLGIFSDVDLGDANDDLPGCDTTLALGYVYNGDNDDGTRQGYGSTPPAIGFLLLQGPVVPGLPDDSARIGDTWRRGNKNLSPSSIITPGKTCCFNQLIDPPDGSPRYAPIAYDYLRGMLGTVNQPLYRPDGSVSLFWFSGDPVTGTGYLPENFPLGPFPPSDLRIMVNAGPFTLARGDTQEVVGAVVIS